MARESSVNSNIRQSNGTVLLQKQTFRQLGGGIAASPDKQKRASLDKQTLNCGMFYACRALRSHETKL
jgi:hypothetical protein